MLHAKKRSGDPCECGEGRMRTITSKPRGEFQLRYLECKLCGVRCRCVVRAADIRKRST